MRQHTYRPYPFLTLLLMAVGPLGQAQDILSPGQRAVPPGPPRPAGRTDRYIVKFRPGTPQSARAAAALQSGALLRHNYTIVDAIAVAAPNSIAVTALRNNPQVAAVIPDRPLYALARKPPNPPPPGGTPIPGGTRQLVSYEVQRVGSPTETSHGADIGVAVVDSGIDFNHADLKPSATAYNGITPGGSCQDDGGHGTHVAGLIAALNNNLDVVGVAPGSTLYCIKAMGGNLSGEESDIIAGLDWIFRNYNTVTPNIRVVNMSLGRPLEAGETIDQTPLHEPIQKLYAKGIVVVAAAGNDPSIEVSQMVPAGYAEVLAVGGTVTTNGINMCTGLHYVPADTAASFTTDGAFLGGRGVTISAPGEERADAISNGFSCTLLLYGVISTTMGGGATRKIPSQAGIFEARGTSFSAALVSGVVARIMQMGLVSHTSDVAEVEAVRNYIRQHADRTGAVPLDHPWAGLVFVYSFDGEREGIVQAPK